LTTAARLPTSFNQSPGEQLISSPSTPDDPSRAITMVLRRIPAKLVRPGFVEFFTANNGRTNALCNRRGARHGFGDNCGDLKT